MIDKITKNPIKISGFAFTCVVALCIAVSSVYTVDTGTRAIVFSGGEATSVSVEGLHMKIPLYQQVKNIDVKTLSVAKRTTAASSDLQRVSSQITVNYRYNKDKLIEIQHATGFDINNTIITPRIDETLKEVTANYTAEQLISNRGEVKQRVDDSLRESLIKYNIVVENIMLTDFAFSDVFNQAIEAKQTAEQETQKAQNILERKEIEAKARIAQATGEAEAIRIQAEAIQAQGGSDYVKLKWIEKWSGDLPTYTGASGGTIMIPTDK